MTLQNSAKSADTCAEPQEQTLRQHWRRVALLKPLIQAKAKEHERAGGGDRHSKTHKPGCQISDNPIDTKKELAKVASVSHNTIPKATVIRGRRETSFWFISWFAGKNGLSAPQNQRKAVEPGSLYGLP